MSLLAVALVLQDYAHGIEAYRRGEAHQAVRLLKRAARHEVRSQPQLLYILARSELAAGRTHSALARFSNLAHGQSVVAGRACWGAAEAAWVLGHKAEARRRYLEALDKAPHEGDAGLALFRAGEHKRLVLEEPDHALAARISVSLTEAERFQRAKQLLERLKFDEATREFDALPGSEARYYAGMARYRSRHAYAEAADLLLGAYRELKRELASSALFHGARALSRADRDDEAIAGYSKLLREYPQSDEAPEAAYLRGWLEYNRARYSEALAPLDEAARLYPKSKFAHDARWFRAWSLYLLGRYADALAALARLEPDATGALGEGKVLYWKARSLERLGRGPEAKRILVEVAQRFPLSWYGLLAHDHGQLPARPAETTLDRPALKHALLELADELLAVGLPDEAKRELRRGEDKYRKRHGKAAIGPLLARLRRAADWNRVYALGLVTGDKRDQYPLAYSELVEKYGPAGGNPDHYLYAIMRKESAFKPNDRSFADARGLLQMIPATSRRVAQALGLNYTDAMLFDPQDNIRLGAWYIGRLFEKFRRQIPLGAAAYNAGPKAVMRWCDSFGSRPTDEFVERIAYTETREYVKKVTSNYAWYRHVYAGDPYQVPASLNCRYEVNEVDY